MPFQLAFLSFILLFLLLFQVRVMKNQSSLWYTAIITEQSTTDGSQLLLTTTNAIALSIIDVVTVDAIVV